MSVKSLLATYLDIALESGKPCVDILKEQWKPTLGLRDVLVMLRQLLASRSWLQPGIDGHLGAPTQSDGAQTDNICVDQGVPWGSHLLTGPAD
jgi:ubiquitin-protein ligase